VNECTDNDVDLRGDDAFDDGRESIGRKRFRTADDGPPTMTVSGSRPAPRRRRRKRRVIRVIKRGDKFRQHPSVLGFGDALSMGWWVPGTGDQQTAGCAPVAGSLARREQDPLDYVRVAASR